MIFRVVRMMYISKEIQLHQIISNRNLSVSRFLRMAREKNLKITAIMWESKEKNLEDDK